MKKRYIKPAIGREFMETSSLLTPSINHVDSQELGSTDTNLSRQGGSFWDDTE